jgi:Holliday junction resolvase RusA-like endonuclease
MKHKGILPFPLYSRGRGDKKKWNLFSMNIFRNMHYQSLNKTKRDYHLVVDEFVKTLPKFKTLTPHYKLYFKGKRAKDIDNFTFPIHKFLMDAMVEGGVIKDDDYNYVKGFSSEFGGIGEENYVVVEITGEEI